MTIKTAQKIWHNGKFIPWNKANIHIMSHVVNYASALFEGIRCYTTPQGPAIFRLRDHIERLRDSCHVYRMDIGYSVAELMAACVELVRINKFQHCYLRPLVFRGYGTFGVNPLPNPVDAYIASWVWDRYLGKDSIEQGVDVCVASWTRLHGNTLPTTAKASANYMNSQLIKMEAITNGFAEGIALDSHGSVSEGSGENIFIVKDGQLYTPPLSSGILLGITRDSAIQIARSIGYKVKEHTLPRASLYTADEVFFTGTAAEITPIRSIDRIKIGKGKRGPITEALQKEFFAITSGQKQAPGDWLTFTNDAPKKRHSKTHK
ncbi:MAG: branched-chain amino acid transaminase [Gammaproteobacteria bacterium]